MTDKYVEEKVVHSDDEFDYIAKRNDKGGLKIIKVSRQKVVDTIDQIRQK
jgi:hypothetical protein